ncbi:hypothetical protein LguiB_000177 [Lonicera macranthoides]
MSPSISHPLELKRLNRIENGSGGSVDDGWRVEIESGGDDRGDRDSGCGVAVEQPWCQILMRRMNGCGEVMKTISVTGVQPCTFYLQKGHCKFGHACKFDHPIIGTTVRYSPSASSLTNIPIAPPVVPSAGNTSTSSVGLIYSQMSSLSLSDVHRSTQGSPTSSITSRSTRPRGEVRGSI